MTEIRVDQESPHTEMHGFAAASISEQATPFSSPNPTWTRSRGPSLHSEPDMDAIMPLASPSPRPMPRQGSVHNEQLLQSGESSAWFEESDRAPLTSVGFTSVEHPMFGHDIFGDDLTAKALDTCKKTVLHPYLGFLKAIGWRRFHPKRYDLRPPIWLTAVNFVWPTFVCILIVLSCVTQVLSCFRRDSVSG